ncbi:MULTISPECIES: carbon-nitrogen hydrolase family protein [unclassified Roseitalea]|uniref:carbon-nitrogen hydrolase family protein n=1 Tax=unclassified Roseitalea TaxID=2639107 RepID=UPI00273D1FE9|nr:MULTISPECIES: carbon-nitrogen hydrolase family protein [unclassified Roseitalea]
MNGSTVRVASVQMALAQTTSIDAFLARLEHHVRAAAGYGADFVCFPEHVTLQLLSGAPDEVPAEETVGRLTEYTAALSDRLSALAVRYRINIVGGSHATRLDDGAARNVALLAGRDGTLARQDKLHPTPDERAVWGIGGGSALDAIETDCGPVGILICYDSEFPEAARRLVDRGARIVFVPYCTDTRHGHLRVHHCCQARTVENQIYVVTAGLVGTLANVANLDMAYAQSAVLTPSDHGFARDGIAAQAEPQVEQMIIADLDMAALDRARSEGSVRNLADRRHDLYRLEWTGE